MHFSLFKAAIRRFKPLFDRILVEKFLPEVVRFFLFHDKVTGLCIYLFFSGCFSEKLTSEMHPPSPPYPLYSPSLQWGSELNLLMAEANEVVHKTKSATVYMYTIMHTKLCDSFFFFFVENQGGCASSRERRWISIRRNSSSCGAWSQG